VGWGYVRHPNLEQVLDNRANENGRQGKKFKIEPRRPNAKERTIPCASKYRRKKKKGKVKSFMVRSGVNSSRVEPTRVSGLNRGEVRNHKNTHKHFMDENGKGDESCLARKTRRLEPRI